jgi:hypothetical protein
MTRPRWHGPVLALCVLALAVVGVLALWGADLRALWRGDDEPAPIEQPVRIPGDVL